jgi:hypothetical protein
MMQLAMFREDSPQAARQPKTDRLILARYLREEADRWNLADEQAIAAAHAILIRWAEFERSGRLAELNETQLQGDFLREVFSDALGYARPVENKPVWNLEQHFSILGQTPDAVLGEFGQGQPHVPLAVVELKGSGTHLDRDRVNGRTAVDQCWDYLVNTVPACRWGIVSNMTSFRLYERDSTKRVYEHFTLQSLVEPKVFRQFYVLFHRKGLIEPTAGQPPWAVALLQRTQTRQREVSDKLYDSYSINRTNLIEYLHIELQHSTEKSIEMAQRLFDRIMFIAFCEDRSLLPENTIPTALKVSGFHAATNPKWENFKNLFRFIDVGNPAHGIEKYNGGLFAKHDVDDLDLPDEPWTTFFNTISGYDFADEVNLDVLGHLFERSITELEKLKATGIFADAEKAERYATMPQSAKRKQLGIYYTPQELTSRIVQYTVGELIDERFAALAVKFGVSKKDAQRRIMPDDIGFWRGCLEILCNLKIVDPACGSGAFLFQAYNLLEHRYLEVIGHLEQAGAEDAEELAREVPVFILNDNMYGVDLSPEAVEITQLALWIRSASPGQTLATLSANIMHGNSLVHDKAHHPAGFVWRERFADVFNRDEAGFDCVIGNPPWERIKLQEREFFSLPAPEIATATNAAKRRTLVAKLESDDPALYGRYQEALAGADSLLTYCRSSNEYPLTGKGDINTYAVFAELGYQLVAPHGRVGLLTPSGIASDKTTMDFFAAVAESNRLIRLYDFENKKVFFPEVHASFKFCILNFGGAAVKHDPADFIFFVHSVEELDDRDRHIALSGDDIKLLNPNTRTCPIFRTKRDAEITKAIYRRVPILIDHQRTGPTANPWGITFQRMFDQTNDAELFREAETLKSEGLKLKGNRWSKGKQSYLPVYEAKMIQAYDHRAANVVTDQANWVRQGQTLGTTQVEWQNPEHLTMPRFWVSDMAVAAHSDGPRTHFLAYKDVTSPTNQRTMIAAMMPFVGVVNSAPLVFTSVPARRECCLLANLNCVAYDFVMRQKISNVHLNFFVVEQVPVLLPDTYIKPCAWSRKKTTLETWISERVLKLTCTAEDMLPLAEACEFTSGSFKNEYGGRLNKWDEAERAQLMAELDAAYFLLYGIDHDDAEYILSTFKGIHTRNPLFEDSASTAEHILATYDALSKGA